MSTRESRIVLRAILLATALLAVPTPGRAAPPLPLEVEAFEVVTDEWVEDFSSGILMDGRPEGPFGVPRTYHWVSPETEPQLILPGADFCGDGVEVVGGGLEIAGPEAFCRGTSMASVLIPGGNAVVRTVYRLPTPFEDADALGVGVGTERLAEFVSLGLTRLDAFGGTLVRLDSELGLIAAASAPAPAGATHIEFVLELTNLGLSVTPTGTFRYCTGLPCAGPFQGLDANPGSSGADAIPARAVYGAYLYTVSGAGTPVTRTVEEFAYRNEIVEDFSDGTFPGTVGYFFLFDGAGTCGTETDFEESGGVLRLLGTNPPCTLPNHPLSFAASLAPAMNTPGDQTGRARYRFKVPGACEYYGLAVGNTTLFPYDAAQLSLIRGPDPADPVGTPDALGVALVAESLSVFGGPSVPIVARTIVSTDPENDPALDGIEAIEFELETVDGLPRGAFRLCTAAGCPPLFTALTPYPGTLFSDDLVCGLPASAFDPPFAFSVFGGGRLQSGHVAGFALAAGTVVPEPTGPLAAVALLGALWLTSRSR